MSRLILVRHAQASFGSADYDQLSAVGEEQAKRLGAHWAGQGMKFDQVFIGPRLRHRRTAQLVGAAFARAALPWPEAVSLPELDEYAGLDVFRASMPPHPNGSSVDLLKAFQGAMLRWVRGELMVSGVETWKEFRIRARRGLERMLESEAHGRLVAAFTSSGPVAAALDLAFGLDDDRMLEAGWQLRNTAVSEFVFSAPRFSLNIFNALPHLTAADLITHI